MRFYVVALVLGSLFVALTGCQSTGSTSNATADTGAGREVGSIIGSEVARDHGYAGGHLGGFVGQQTERTITQER